MRKIALVILILCIQSLNGFSQSYYMQIKKALADAVSISTTITLLPDDGAFREIKQYSADFDTLFALLEEYKTDFVIWSYPLACEITDENRVKVYRTVSLLNQLVTRVRVSAERFQVKFPSERIPELLTLMSENAGEYYVMVDSVNQFDLYEHPLRSKIEFMGLQDYPLREFMKVDTSLIRIHHHSPHLKVLYLFGSEVDYALVDTMKLEQCYYLQALELSENSIDSLPVSFNQNNRLRYLSLRRNNLERLPEGYEKWNSLEYLDLSQNVFLEVEQKRIKEALPNAIIKF